MTPWGNCFPGLSAPVADPVLRILSLGGGVQSTTLAEAAARGDVGPMPDCAIFADTGWEPKHVIDHVAHLKERLPFPIHIVSAGNLRDDIFAGQNTRTTRMPSVPFFIKNPDGSIGMGRRQCTAHYKLEPIKRKVRSLLGVGPRARIAPGSVEMWIGISTDEVVRLTPSRVQYIVNRFPLIEANMSRRDCERWLAERQLRAAKSACLGCSFRSNAEWRHLRDNYPDEWMDTVKADYIIRDGGSTKPLKGQQFMHKSCVPLDRAPIDEAENGPSLFNNECLGMCWS